MIFSGFCSNSTRFCQDVARICPGFCRILPRFSQDFARILPGFSQPVCLFVCQDFARILRETARNGELKDDGRSGIPFAGRMDRGYGSGAESPRARRQEENAPGLLARACRRNACARGLGCVRSLSRCWCASPASTKRSHGRWPGLYGTGCADSSVLVAARERVRARERHDHRGRGR